MKLKYFIPPQDGLKPHTVYKVEYASNETNPIKLGILSVGYLDHVRLPSVHSSSLIVRGLHKTETINHNAVYYIKVIEVIELETPFRYISDIQNIFELEYHNIQRNNHGTN